jgi:hypothetical protein
MGLKERESGWEDTPLTEEEEELVDYIFNELPTNTECPRCYTQLEPLADVDFSDKKDDYFNRRKRKQWKLFIAGLVDLVHNNTKMVDLLVGGKTK